MAALLVVSDMAVLRLRFLHYTRQGRIRSIRDVVRDTDAGMREKHEHYDEWKGLQGALWKRWRLPIPQGTLGRYTRHGGTRVDPRVVD